MRERKKEATRRALHDAAMKLALERGLENVTLDAVADAANVSRRTFSNYFANKEDALLYGDQQRVTRLLEAIRARPARESAWKALVNGAADRFADATEIDPHFEVQLRLVRRHPSLLARQLGLQAGLERDIADEIAKRLPDRDEVQARIMAAVFLATVRAVLHGWVESGGPAPIRDVVADGLARAGAAFK